MPANSGSRESPLLISAVVEFRVESSRLLELLIHAT